jgi:hypothetical protein
MDLKLDDYQLSSRLDFLFTVTALLKTPLPANPKRMPTTAGVHLH